VTNPAWDRHAPQELRDAFAERVKTSRDRRNDVKLHALAEQLTDCSDVMPPELCTLLDLPMPSTYWMGARALLRVRPRPAFLRWDVEVTAGDQRGQTYERVMVVISPGTPPREDVNCYAVFVHEADDGGEIIGTLLSIAPDEMRLSMNDLEVRGHVVEQVGARGSVTTEVAWFTARPSAP
jgi:hypothetical protein